MTPLRDVIAGLEPIEGGWRGTVPDGWLQGRTAYGGFSAALAADERELKTIDERTSVVEGQIRVEDVNEELDLDIPEGDYETLAGFVLARLGRLPAIGDGLTYKNVRLTVLKMEGPRIVQIEITRL